MLMKIIHFKSLSFLLLLSLMASSCQTLIGPEFKDIKDFKVNLAGFSSVNVSGEALFHNPNKRTIHIKHVDMDVAVDGQKVTHISQAFNIKAKGLEDFTVPIDLELSLKDLQINSISSALAMLGGDEKQIHFKGKIKVKAYGFNFKVPIDHIESLKVRR